jgi:hypothetical protein
VEAPTAEHPGKRNRHDGAGAPAAPTLTQVRCGFLYEASDL